MFTGNSGAGGGPREPKFSSSSRRMSRVLLEPATIGKQQHLFRVMESRVYIPGCEWNCKQGGMLVVQPLGFIPVYVYLCFLHGGST